MAFDAGAVEAKLTIDLSAFNRDLDKAEVRVKKFEDEPHRVKIAAEFDGGSMARGRKMFTDLDNAISKDAMNRLRSSPQGSVLGSLNALFSPHPLTGAPSAAQSAQGGLLGKMLSPGAAGAGAGGAGGNYINNGNGSGGNNGSGSGGNGSSPLATALAQQASSSSTDNIRQNLTGTAPGNVTTTDDIRQALIGQGAANVTTTDDIKQALIGQGATNTTTTDDIKQNLVGTAPGNVKTTDDIAQKLTGTGAAANVKTTDTINQKVVGAGAKDTATTDTVKEKLDPAAASGTEKASGDSGKRAGGQWSAGFGVHLGPFFTSFRKQLGDAGNYGGAAMSKGLVSGIGPGILGVSLKLSSIVGAAGAALGTLPALAGVIGTGMGVALIGGAVAEVVKTSPELKAQFTSIGAEATSMFKAASAPLIPAIHDVLAQVPALIKGLQAPLAGIFKTIAPQVQGVFSGLIPIISGLVKVMAAAAPAFGPFIGAIEKLVGGLLPGIATVIKATVPFVSQFAGLLGSLGGSLGTLFATAAPAIGASMKILGGLLGLVGDLLPIIMRLADIFATSLAPVFTEFAGVVQMLLKPLTLVGSVIASFAGAVIGDLASAFGAVATLITAIGPGLAILATTLGSVFTVLENTGTFAELGNALELIAKPLGNLVDLLLTKLSPVLPVLVQALSSVVTVVAELAGAGLDGIVIALSALVSAIPAPVLDGIALAVIGIGTAFKAFAIIKGIVVGVQAAMVLFQASAIEFATSNVVLALASAAAWVSSAAATVGAFVAMAAAATIAFIAENIATLGIIAGIALLIAAIVYAATHWSQVWGDITAVAKAAADFVLSDVIDPFVNWFTKSLPNAWDVAAAAVMTDFVTPLENALKAAWTWVSTVFGTDVANLFTKTIPGYWTTAITYLGTHFVTPLENDLKAAYSWVVANVAGPINTLFTKTLPGYWSSAINFLTSNFVTPFENKLKAAYTWVVTNVADPLETLFTKTLPGWFSTAVTGISGFWGKIEGVVEAPVKFVVNSVIDKLADVFNDITNAVGLGKPIPIITLAGGGLLSGYGGGDRNLALLEDGEAVIDKDRTRKLAPLLKAMGVPGFAAGGVLPGRGGALGATTVGGSPIPGGGVIKDITSGVASVVDKAGDLAKAALAITTDNPTALANAITGLFGKASADGLGGTLGKAALAMPAKLIGDFGKWVISQVTAASAGGSGGGSTSLKPTGTGATIQALMQSMAASVGWTGAQWTALNAVEEREAGYSITAQNPGSGAYGLAQFINGATEYAAYGGNSTTAAGQITGMLNYIKQRYGDPEAAEAHEVSFGWYGSGGIVSEPVVGYGVNSGRGYVIGERGPEMITPLGGNNNGAPGSAALLAKLDQLIMATRQIPAGVGSSVGGAIGGSSHTAAFRSRFPRGGS